MQNSQKKKGKEKTMKIYDTIIIGAGPAGCAAAIYLKRCGHSLLVLEKGKIGGLILNANRIENYIGLRKAVSGKEFVSNIKRQILKWNVPIIHDEVLEIHASKVPTIITKGKREYCAKTIIIATGSSPKKLGIKGEADLAKKHVFYEVAEIPTLRKKRAQKRVIVIGGGDAGCDYALTLQDKGYAVTLITRSKLQGIAVLKQRLNLRKITHDENVKPIRIAKEKDNIILICKNQKYDADLLLIATGRSPQIPKIVGRKRERIYVATNLLEEKYRQIHITTGQAITTAMKVSEYLKNDKRR